MNSVFVYLEIEEGHVLDVSLELLTKGRSLATQLNVPLEAVAITAPNYDIATQVMPYGVDVLHLFEDSRLEHYITAPYATIVTQLFEQEKPQIALLGATHVGRDLGPRISSALFSGLTADCTSLEIGDHTDARTRKEYENLLYQIRPAFGGNIVATIINPDHRPQMATVRPGVMKKQVFDPKHQGKVVKHDTEKILSDADFAVRIVERHIAQSRIDIAGAPIIIAGGYGVGSKENFQLLHQLADLLGGAEVGASRAAVDAGFTEHERQIGQTGVTVRPKLYIACGISGQIQHVAGMQESSMVISINNDPDAPINAFADYVIVGNVEDVLPKFINSYKKNSK